MIDALAQWWQAFIQQWWGLYHPALLLTPPIVIVGWMIGLLRPAFYDWLLLLPAILYAIYWAMNRYIGLDGCAEGMGAPFCMQLSFVMQYVILQFATLFTPISWISVLLCTILWWASPGAWRGKFKL